MRLIYSLSLATLLLSASLCKSQTRFGATLGGLFTRNTIAPYTEGGVKYTNKSRVSYSLGLAMSHELGKHTAIKSNLLFTDKGDRTEGGSGASLEEYSYRLTQLELPVNLVYTSGGRDGGFFVGGGPYFGLGLSASEKFKNDGTVTDYTFGEDLKRGEFGLNLVAGYETKGGFYVNLRYARSFNDVYIGYGTNKNTLTGLYLGYYFRNGNKSQIGNRP